MNRHDRRRYRRPKAACAPNAPFSAAIRRDRARKTSRPPARPYPDANTKRVERPQFDMSTSEEGCSKIRRRKYRPDARCLSSALSPARPAAQREPDRACENQRPAPAPAAHRVRTGAESSQKPDPSSRTSQRNASIERPSRRAARTDGSSGAFRKRKVERGLCSRGLESRTARGDPSPRCCGERGREAWRTISKNIVALCDSQILGSIGRPRLQCLTCCSSLSGSHSSFLSLAVNAKDCRNRASASRRRRSRKGRKTSCSPARNPCWSR